MQFYVDKNASEVKFLFGFTDGRVIMFVPRAIDSATLGFLRFYQAGVLF